MLSQTCARSAVVDRGHDHGLGKCSWPARSSGAFRKFILGNVLEQFQGSIEAPTDEQASRYPISWRAF